VQSKNGSPFANLTITFYSETRVNLVFYFPVKKGNAFGGTTKWQDLKGYSMFYFIFYFLHSISIFYFNFPLGYVVMVME